ncbi:MAG: hypothetical protein P4L69_17410 [Desulfosporosinus sp.]|nr:hypothetical protein [Desulfosporosinus sp.]
MTKGYKTRYKAKLPDRDVDMFVAMYQLQVVSEDDLVAIFHEGRGYGKKRIQQLTREGYLERTYKVREKGSRQPGQAYGTVFGLTDQAIAELAKIEKIEKISYPPRRARDLRLPTLEMLQQLEVSKIALNIERAGWKVLGRMDSKQQLSLSHYSMIQLVITSPEGEPYQVYVVKKSIQDQTLTKLITELGEIKHKSIILYKTEGKTAKAIGEKTPAFESIVNKITEQDISKQELCLIPMTEWEEGGRMRNFAIEALLNSSEGQVERYLRKRYGKVRYSDNLFHFGNMVVEQEGIDYLVCNYLRRDQTALRALARYLTQSEYEKNKKGAIVLTWIGFVKEAQQIIDSYQRRDFIQVKGLTIKDIIDSQ